MLIIVKNKVWISGANPDEVKKIKEFLTISNPLFNQRLDLGLMNWGVPSKLIYYEYDPKTPDVIIAPVGSLPDLINTGIITPKPEDIIDQRVEGAAPQFFSRLNFTGTLRGYQEDLVKACEGPTMGVIEAMTGCHAKGTKILMYSGEYKNVEEIDVKDTLMGWDSTPREVLNLCRGKGPMYKITPNRGEPFIINDEHVLTLKHTTTKEVIDISLKDWFGLKNHSKHLYKLFRTGVDFETTREVLPMDPYFLGLLLGDGSFESTIKLTTNNNDTPIVQEVYKQGLLYNLDISVSKNKIGNCRTYSFVQKNNRHRWNTNKVALDIKLLSLDKVKCENKFVPSIYKKASKEVRLQILAGLLDTDGHLASSGCFDYISRSKQLATDVAFIARSLGFYAIIKPKFKPHYTKAGEDRVHYRVFIGGNIGTIPCKLKRKQALSLKPNKDSLTTGFKVEALGNGEYYGFSLDGDQRYLFEEFWVTHNSGKTISFISMVVQKKVPSLILTHTIELAEQTKQAFLQFTNATEEDIGFIGSGNFKLSPITICLHQTMAQLSEEQYALLNTYYGMIIADECHNLAATTFYATMCKLAAKYKYSFSATPKRSDGLTDVIHFATGPTIHVVPKEDLKDVLVQPDLVFKNTNYYYPLLNSSEYQELMTDLSFDQDRNDFIVDVFKKEYANNYVIFLCNRIEQVDELLKRIGPTAVGLTSKMKKKDRKQAILDINNKIKQHVVSTYGLFSTGLDVKHMDTLFMCAPIKSEIKIRQSAGRLMRKAPGKTTATIVDFVDSRVQLLNYQAATRRRILMKI